VKPDPKRADPARYPYSFEVQPRFNDMDVLRHLNNVALAAVYEEGRIAMHRAFDKNHIREPGTRTVVAQVNISYLDEGHYPDVLEVAAGVSRIGRSSYTILQGLFQNGRCIGVADTVIVNTKDGRSHPLTPAFRAGLETLKIDIEGDADG
jgi:acyl-CoA thioester hydrolase